MEKKEFKEGDYIVTLRVKGYEGNCAKDNWCFKQRCDASYIRVVRDTINSSNGNDSLRFDLSKKLKDWRYATPEEIAEYHRLGKPYDVTTIKHKDLYPIY